MPKIAKLERIALRKIAVRAFSAGLLLAATVGPGHAADGLITRTDARSCKTLVDERESLVRRCAGPGGYGMIYSDSVMRAGVTFTYRGRDLESSDDDLRWLASHVGIGARIDWRLGVDGRPYAAIFGAWSREMQDDGEQPVFLDLVVVKLEPGAACRMATIQADASRGHATARKVAQVLAPEFRCMQDTPIVLEDPLRRVAMRKAALPAGAKPANNPGTWIPDRELLEHNESLMLLTKTSDGTIEIRYQEPRPSLSVRPGTLLFEGRAERDGRVKGTAYTFKDGCAPASYAVTGEREGRTLVLRGPAPRRDTRSCAVIGRSGSSAHAELVFTHEAVDADVVPPRHSIGLSFSDCARGCVNASIFRVEGLGTRKAIAEARATPDDAANFCSSEDRMTESSPICVQRVLNDERLRRAEADCAAKTIRPTMGGSYSFAGLVDDVDGKTPTWRDTSSGQIACGARSCVGPSVTYQFSLLCPGGVPGWRGRGF